MPENTGNTPLRVTVYGSCVARDTVDLAGGGALQVTAYVARQSLLSIGNDASARFPADAHVDSAFQRRNMLGDFAGDAARRLVAAADRTDLLLWDLADERHGVQAYPGGDVVTRSIDIMKNPSVKAALRGSLHIPLGDDDHFDSWAEAASRFRDELDAAGLVERTVVLAVPWAEVSADGSPTPASMGITAPDANARYTRYYEHLRSLGLRMLEVDAAEVRGDPGHRWGHAPFHYAQGVYDGIVQRLLEG